MVTTALVNLEIDRFSPSGDVEANQAAESASLQTGKHYSWQFSDVQSKSKASPTPLS